MLTSPHNSQPLRRLFSLALTLIVGACSSPPSEQRYGMSNDTAPDSAPTLAHLENPVPRYEAYSRQGNRDYTVRGKNYQVWRDIKEHETTGNASWYGKKFHGHLTSNGEIYDMYSLSAAHKNLPLPSYVEVTNLSNDKSVIVRVNDRGPFHQERIIDLSFAAAYKLDMLKSGTAKVKIKLLKFDNTDSNAERAFIDGKQYYVQLVASKNTEVISQHRSQLDAAGLSTVLITENGWQKLRVGPYYDVLSAENTLLKMQQSQYKDAYIINRKAK
ncbi:septal ring lytic transglycosylase RlpA family protein [Agarivorans sp. TSD2052]|uniref:septal ring lytic transglycosylase RlpA family protein n=1 Tax=Agarivorans sp. TSD2052 TaxID=2937286 RepID=UPI00200D08F1|nr:septal ring lytic transglycosylase RlpA family protein [Agarivorans sp. TSD2052]UPW19888.1 septal ring lytic transglycosylase RlpA family protein [Agarivorans sp. TSD2052]